MTADSHILLLTICSFNKDEGGSITYDGENGIARHLRPQPAAQLLAARRQVRHLITTPGAVLREQKALDELRQNKELVLGPDFDPDYPESGGRYLPAAHRYTGRFYSRLGNDPLATLTDTPHHVLIISGLYGLLRPSEPIQCYSCHVPDHPDVPAAWMATGALVNALATYIEQHQITRVFELMGDNNYRQLIAWNQLQTRTGVTVLHTVGENYSGPDLLPSLGRLVTQLVALPEEALLAIKSGDSREVSGESITFQDHPSLAASIAQASTYSGMGDHKHALEVLSALRPENDNERRQLQERRLEILLAAEQHLEVIQETSTASVPMYWLGLRGVALAALHRMTEADTALGQAWTSGDRHPVVAHEVARRAMDQGNERLASEAYRVILEERYSALDARDHHHIAVLIEMGTHDGDRLAHADAFAATARERELSELPYAPDTLRWRVERSRVAGDTRQLQRDYADLADCYCLRGDLQGIKVLLGDINRDRERRLLTRQEQFDILEGLEPFTSDLLSLPAILSTDYLAIAYAEFDLALRDDRPMPSYIRGLLRALEIRDASSHNDLARYFRSEQDKLRKNCESVSATQIANEATVTLGGLRLALVGGHQQARHQVLDTLAKKHGLLHSVEVAPTSEGRLDTRAVSNKITNCDLVIVIKGYIGHDLSGIVGDLARRGRLHGSAHWIDTRGQSGVVREILEIVAKLHDR